MPDLYYKEALKLGLKEYRTLVKNGRSPLPSILDDFIPETRSMAGTDLGIIQIPSEFIVGTKSRGRDNSFAANFMPILDEGTEFATKWESLCQAHLEEGIRDPIVAYEYMNRYYIEEGNKRVSVLKFFNAPTITGRVIRILPERNSDTAQYFEYLDFYKLSKVNSIELSNPGDYQTLQKLVGKAPDEPWTEEDRRHFSAAYYYFKQAYTAMGGTKLHSTIGDAMLAYIEVYGFSSLRGKSEKEIRQSISKVWEEIALKEESAPIDIKLSPTEKKPGIISKVLSGNSPKLLRVAFIHDGRPDISAWTRGHERGREYVQRVMEEQILTTAYYDALDDEPGAVIDQAIADGNTVIFTTSARLMSASLRVAVEHPEVMIFNCSLNASHRYIRTYYARMYEVKFLIGVIAGALAGNDPVGYMADYPIYGIIAGINAFARGVQMVSPKTKVFLEWSSVGGADAAMQRLTDRGIRLISSQDLVRVGKEGSSSLGLTMINEGEQINLAMPLWQWGTYYERLLRLIQNRSAQAEYTESSRALNYYWGLSAGVVELKCSDKVPSSVIQLVDMLQDAIRADVCEPFKGPLYSQDGKVLEANHTLSPEQIINMDYLVENVIGEIPVYDQLTDLGKATVDAAGVDKASRGMR